MVGSPRAGLAGAEGGGPKLVARTSGSLGLVLRDDPMLSAGSAGMPSITVASTGAGRAAPFAAGPPLALTSLAGASFAGAGASCVSSGGVVLAEPGFAAAGLRDDC
jgi:hypothetical protein